MYKNKIISIRASKIGLFVSNQKIQLDSLLSPSRVALVYVIASLLFVPSCTFADSMRWKAAPSDTNAWFDTKAEAVADFMSVGDIYTYMEEVSPPEEFDDYIKITYKIPDAPVSIGPWIYHMNLQYDCPDNESLDELLDCHYARNLEHILGPAVDITHCGEIYVIDRSSGVWTDYQKTFIAKIINQDDRGYADYSTTYYHLVTHYDAPPTCEPVPSNLNLYRSRSMACQYPTTVISTVNGNCYNANTATVYGYAQYYLSPDPDICGKTEANPCNPATGNKTQTETDYSMVNSSLMVQRYYSSQGVGDGFDYMGPRWRHNHSNRFDGYRAPSYSQYQGLKSSLHTLPQDACVDGWNSIKSDIYRGQLSDGVASYNSNKGVCEISKDGSSVTVLPIHNTMNGRKGIGASSPMHTINRPNGSSITFSYDNEQWKPLYPTNASLSQISTGWLFTAADGSKEEYDEEGKLVKSTAVGGLTTTYSYDGAGRVTTVTDHFGNTLLYSYDGSGLLTTISTPGGDLNYSYDSYGRLVSVTYPDNKQRFYHYENTTYTNNLTGVSDENNNRYATWSYDAEGRAILSEHAGGAERVTFAYNPDGTTTVTDAAGATRTYHFIVVQGGLKVSHIEGDRCTNCSASDAKAYTYDDNGFLSSKTDWNGNVTSYIRDARGLEVSRTVASGTPQERTITTQWHPQYRLPTKVTESNKITEYTYDAQGRQLSRKVSGIQ